MSNPYDQAGGQAPLEFRTDHLRHALHTYHYRATGAPLGRVLLIQHGLSEHAGRYAHVARAFAAEGYEVFLWDHQGHGRSSGKRGTITGWPAFTAEVNSVRAEAERRLGTAHEVCLWGHSMGALALLYYLRHNPAAAGVRAAVATAPPLRLSFSPSPAIVRVAGLLAAVAPDLTKANEIDPRTLSRDPAVVSLYLVDPLVHDRVSMRLGASLLAEADALLRGAVELPCPLLLMHGDADGVCHVDGSRAFAARATAGAPVTFRVWPGLYHELHNEPEQREVLALARDFLASPLNPPA